MRLRRLKQTALVLAALVLLYAAAGFLLMPWLIEHRLAPLLQERLGQSVSVGTARVNPFLLTLEVRDVRIKGLHDRPVVAFDRLSADMAWAVITAACAASTSAWAERTRYSKVSGSIWAISCPALTSELKSTSRSRI